MQNNKVENLFGKCYTGKVYIGKCFAENRGMNE